MELLPSSFGLPWPILNRATLRPAPAGRPWGWLVRLAGQLKVQSPWRLILNLAALAALMRFWPMPGTRHPLGVNEPITVQVRFWLESSLSQCVVRGGAGRGRGMESRALPLRDGTSLVSE